MATTGLNSWSQRALAKRTREAERLEILRAAAGAYLGAVDIYMGWTFDLETKLKRRAPQNQIEEVYQKVLDSWAALTRAGGPLQVAGPKGLCEKADAFGETVSHYGDALDVWYRDATNGQDEGDRRPGGRRAAAWKIRNEFAGAVRDLLGSESPVDVSRPPRRFLPLRRGPATK